MSNQQGLLEHNCKPGACYCKRQNFTTNHSHFQIFTNVRQKVSCNSHTTRDGLILPGTGTASGFPPSKLVRISAIISSVLPRPMSSASIPDTRQTHNSPPVISLHLPPADSATNHRLRCSKQSFHNATVHWKSTHR